MSITLSRSPGRFAWVQVAILGAVLAVSGCASQQQLLDAAQSGEEKSAIGLIESGMNPYLKNENGVSPIDAALSWADSKAHTQSYRESITPEWVKVRLKESAIEAEEILKGIESGELSAEEFKALLAQNTFYLDVKVGSLERHLLHHFALTDLPEYSQALVHAGANVNASDNQGHTPLFIALGASDPRLTSILLNAGAEVSATNEDGQNALIMPSIVPEQNMSGALMAADLVVDAGGDVNHISDYGRSILSRAVQGEKPAYRDFLIDQGADLDKAEGDALPPLHYAILNGSLDDVEVLLKAGANVNAKGGNNRYSPLNLLASRPQDDNRNPDQDLAIAELLLAADANVSSTDKHGQTPFVWAVKHGRFDQADLYLEYGADIDQQWGKGFTALLKTVAVSNLRSTRYLLKNGANVNVPAADGLTSLHAAVVQGDEASHRIKMAIAKALMKADPDFGVRDGKGNSPLHLAAFYGDSDMTALLLENGAEVTIENKSGDTPFHLAIKALEVGTAKLLLDHGADINASMGGKSPVLIATLSYEGDKSESEINKMVRFLLGKGVDPDAFHPGLGINALYRASLAGNHEAFDLIAQASSDLDALMRGDDEPWSGETVLHNTTQYIQPNFVKTLLEHGSDPNARDIEDMTPLHTTGFGMSSAESQNMTKIAEILINSGANPNAKTPDLITPLHIAAVNGNSEIADVLLKNGADPEMTTISERTAMDIAKEKNSYGVISAIRRHQK